MSEKAEKGKQILLSRKYRLLFDSDEITQMALYEYEKDGTCSSRLLI